MIPTRSLVGLVLALALVPASGLLADESRPPILRDVAFAQRIGTRLPLDVALRDHGGRIVRLGDVFGERPVVLVPAYATCPMLCPLVRAGVVSALRALPFDVGEAFTVVTFSFDPRDGPEQAAALRAEALASYRRPGATTGWHHLVGDVDEIRRLTDALGFRFAWDEASGEYAHASGIVVATPAGTISHYLYGAEYAPRDLRLALVEASAGRLGSPVDQLLLFCFRYDPATGRYSRVALGAVRLGGVLTVVLLGLGVGRMLRRERV